MDRGMKKWMPFDSVTSSKQMVQHIIEEKSKVSRPSLSEEQKEEIERTIWEGFHNQVPLRIVYFFRGRYQVKQNLFILDIQLIDKKIILDDYSSLYFDQIIRVSEI